MFKEFERYIKRALTAIPSESVDARIIVPSKATPATSSRSCGLFSAILLSISFFGVEASLS
jgi:hypothetical protein